jgi:hypothetical protein
MTEAKAALSRIAFAADEAYLLGEGNSRELSASALSGATINVSSGSLAASIGGTTIKQACKFRAQAKTLAISGSSPRILIRCCTPEGVEFTSSTSSP